MGPIETATARAYRTKPFELADFALFQLQQSQAETEDYDGPANEADWQKIVRMGDGYTLFRDELCIGCGGAITYDATAGGAAYVWARIARTCDRHDLLHCTRAIVEYLAKYPARRIVLLTADRFPRAARWAEVLGFEEESVLNGYCPDGSDARLFVQKKEL